MENLKKTLVEKHLLIINLSLIIFAFLYYLFFINRGLNLGDEGYYLHYAERIVKGEIPYKDFALQYTPGYFYLLAIFFKLFGIQVVVGRFLSLTFCILILISSLYLLHLYNIKSKKIIIISGLTVVSLGYPLLYLPIVAWPCVLMAVLIEICYIKWNRDQRLQFIAIIGLFLALMFFFKQSIGIAFLLILNLLVFLNSKQNIKHRLKTLFVLNSSWIFFSLIWIYFVFIRAHNLAGITLLFAYSRQFVSHSAFTYPPLSYIFQPTGFFKLLPYYYPLIYGFFVFLKIFKKQFDWEKLSFSIIALTGFCATVYPASDLLHVYPFLGLIIISSIIFFYDKGLGKILFYISIIFILMGLYLTFFTKSYRYDQYFLRENTLLSLPKTKGILYDKSDATIPNLISLYDFISTHTKKGEYIFVYPFAPTLYFVLDRPNPSGVVQFIILEPPSSIYPEERVISEIKRKKVKYIITMGQYKYDKKISKFIQKQKEVFRSGFIVFEIK